ncbi:telomere-protecting terminal protein Tpg [Streptomyces fuscigenes]|uniref:telomere-protecting terminal protein Tpg n=1 Tax=Streptomyces fuscigenes TaxID=1528880 RepID=UPI001F38FC61|nr:hypothetical protein [Streptomyces fuscigenes]
MRFLVRQAGRTRPVAQLLGISQRTLERYVRDQIRRPRPELADWLAGEVRGRWPPRVRARASRQAATSTGNVVTARARFGYSAPIGTSDDPRQRTCGPGTRDRTRVGRAPPTPGRPAEVPLAG